jgi:hypothetical protein
MKDYFIIIMICFLLNSCTKLKDNREVLIESSTKPAKNNVDKQQFKEYWHSGKAEITTYKLSQVRYGELHKGHSVLIYVTEQFLPERQIKADSASEENISILKLNSTKNFLTGIYPYSLMSSVFSPISTREHALKISFSSQEWCGQTYIQLNNKKEFEFQSHSYFEKYGDASLKIKQDYLEDEIWNILRISPDNLPLGNVQMIPSMEFLGMQHKAIETYEANVTLQEKDSLMFYQIEYPKLDRVLVIKFSNEFPYAIEGWEETFTNYFEKPVLRLTTTAEKLKRIKIDYWNKNKNSDISIRARLGL